MKKVYIAGRLEKSCEVSMLGMTSKVQLYGLADGCIGAMLVFSNKKKAKKFAGKHSITEAEAGLRSETNQQAERGSQRQLPKSPTPEASE